MRVNILMSTYNGEKFVADQIESIQKQTYTDWYLIIRVDGSSNRICENVVYFVCKETSTTEIYTLSLHAAMPIGARVSAD